MRGVGNILLIGAVVPAPGVREVVLRRAVLHPTRSLTPVSDRLRLGARRLQPCSVYPARAPGASGYP